MKEKDYMFKKRSKTICWDCANACGGCCWSKSFKPVDGWEATPTKVYQSEGKFAESFEVHRCPKFIKDNINNLGTITPKELAKKMGVCEKTIYRTMSNDLIKKAKKQGFNLEIKYEDGHRKFYVQKSANKIFIPIELLKKFFGKNQGYTGF